MTPTDSKEGAQEGQEDAFPLTPMIHAALLDYEHYRSESPLALGQGFLSVENRVA